MFKERRLVALTHVPKNNVYQMQMKMKFSKVAIVALLVVILYILLKGRTSNYISRGGADIGINPGKTVMDGVASIFDVKNNLKCVPGPGGDSAYYTQDLTPGGLCGDMQFVKSQQRDFTISSGIGGSLLDRLA
jgi:urease alpha subunit